MSPEDGIIELLFYSSTGAGLWFPAPTARISCGELIQVALLADQLLLALKVPDNDSIWFIGKSSQLHWRQRKGYFVGYDGLKLDIYTDFEHCRQRIRHFIGDNVISDGNIFQYLSHYFNYQLYSIVLISLTINGLMEIACSQWHRRFSISNWIKNI